MNRHSRGLDPRIVPRFTKTPLRELVEVVAFGAILFLIVSLLMQTVRVMGHSMDSTLHDQDLLIATKFDYHLHHPQRGDIVIVKLSNDHSTDYIPEQIIKRVVGTPGERVSVVGGQVSINGGRLDEPYRKETICDQNCDWPADDPASGVVLAADQYFVMGDNRNDSKDSRVIGPVRGDQIESRAWLRIWPLGRPGPISPPPRLTGVWL